jgi:hypothetical protein
MKILILGIPLFLAGCAHFSYETEDLIICDSKQYYISEFCTKTICGKFDNCGKITSTYKK